MEGVREGALDGTTGLPANAGPICKSVWPRWGHDRARMRKCRARFALLASPTRQRQLHAMLLPPSRRPQYAPLARPLPLTPPCLRTGAPLAAAVVEEAPGPASNGGAPHAERSAALQREGSAPSSVHAEPSNEDDEAEAAAKPNATQPKAVKAAAAAAEEEEEAAEAAAAKEAAVDGGDADAEAADDEDGGTAAGAKAAGGDAAEKQQQKPDGASPARTGAVAARARMAAQNPNAELVRASDPLDEVRSSPVRITDLSKQLKEQFESGGSGGSGGGGAGSDGGKDGNMSARSASAAALTQHDLVNTANVALVGVQPAGSKPVGLKGRGGRTWVTSAQQCCAPALRTSGSASRAHPPTCRCRVPPVLAARRRCCRRASSSCAPASTWCRMMTSRSCGLRTAWTCRARWAEGEKRGGGAGRGR
jgi:hypothetical protein